MPLFIKTFILSLGFCLLARYTDPTAQGQVLNYLLRTISFVLAALTYHFADKYFDNLYEGL